MRLPISCHGNLGPILPRLRDIAGFLVRIWPTPLFHPNFGVFPFDQVADVGVSPRQNLILNKVLPRADPNVGVFTARCTSA